MPGDDDDRELFDDEHPGPQVLESALANTALSEVVSQPPLMVPLRPRSPTRFI